MTLLQMHVFNVIALTRNLTKAGEALNLTQSAISQTLSGLEAEIGLILFNRGRNGVSLTDAGEKLLPYARALLQSEEQFIQVTSSLTGIQKGTLKIGCFPSFMARQMPDLIKAFKVQYPNITIIFKEGNYDQITDMLLDGTIDVGINVYAEAPVSFIPLMEDSMLVVMPQDHILGKQSDVSVEQIINEPFIQDTGCEHFLEKVFPDPALQPNYQFAVTDTFAILAMVQAGLGITVLPDMSVPKELFTICTSQLRPKHSRTIGVCYNSRRALSPATSAFIRIVTELTAL